MKKIDFHIHLTENYPITKATRNMKKLCEKNGYQTVCLQTLTHVDSHYIQKANETAFEVKRLIPDIYLFACPVHDGTSYVEQTKELLKKGADGIKLLIGKPSEYRDLNVKYSDPLIDEFFSYVQEEDIPVLLHHNDPEKHWDKSRMSQESIDRGWYYDPAVMPLYDYFDRELEKMLSRYPKLRIAIAHMGFYSNKLDHLTKLMETYPKLYMDITPALDIYEDLSREVGKAQAFFERFSDRLIYGTDGWSDLGENEKKSKV